MNPRIRDWIEDRLRISSIRAVMDHKEVPVHRHGFWYFFGGMALFLFAVQFATGILLLFYYKPTGEEAFESVQFIMTEVRFGWLVRSVHSWSANLLIAVLFVHAGSVFFLRAFRRPRELTWVSGALLLFLGMGFGFTGYLLPWNKLALFATKVGTQIPSAVPWAGPALVRFLRGGDEVTAATLGRFFAIHVWVLPAALAGLLGLHLYLVQSLGMSVPPSEEGKSLRKMKFFPDFLLRDAVGWLAAVGVLAALAALFPWELGEKADPFAPAPAGIKPEWYFLSMFQALKKLPAHIGPLEGEAAGVLFFNLIGALFVLAPFLASRLRWPWLKAAAASGLAVMAVLTVWAWLS